MVPQFVGNTVGQISSVPDGGADHVLVAQSAHTALAILVVL